MFRDELGNLMPADEDAKRLARQTLTLSEFVARHAAGHRWPALARRALVHGHCHHKAVMGFAADEALLRRLGLDVEILDAGCCGMAGSGFEREHYDISMRIGERALLPAVRRAAPDTLIVADGFSWREQVVQATGRRPLHLAQVLAMSLGLPVTGELAGADRRALRRRRRLALAGAGAAAAGAVWALRERRAA